MKELKAILINKYKLLFILGLLIKIIIVIVFSVTGPSIQTKWFHPFVDYFFHHPFSNPYGYFFSLGIPESFPYPALMLYILAFFKLVLGWITPNNIYWNTLVLKIPLFIADTIIFFILRSWLKKYEMQLLLLYWFSPVLIYISYIYGQLDVIPIALLFCSLFFLFQEKFFLSILFVGLAVSTKTNIVLVVPFIFLYIFSYKISFKKLVSLLLILVLVFIVLNINYLNSKSFISMVLKNQVQAKVLLAHFTIINYNFYYIPAIFIMTLIVAATIKIFNRDIFIMLLSIVFGAILFFIPPIEGWYFWLIPFFVLLSCS